MLGIDAVLNAAALTYVAAVVSTLPPLSEIFRVQILDTVDIALDGSNILAGFPRGVFGEIQVDKMSIGFFTSSITTMPRANRSEVPEISDLIR